MKPKYDHALGVLTQKSPDIHPGFFVGMCEPKKVSA